MLGALPQQGCVVNPESGPGNRRSRRRLRSGFRLHQINSNRHRDALPAGLLVSQLPHRDSRSVACRMSRNGATALRQARRPPKELIDVACIFSPPVRVVLRTRQHQCNPRPIRKPHKEQRVTRADALDLWLKTTNVCGMSQQASHCRSRIFNKFPLWSFNELRSALLVFPSSAR